MAEPRSTAQRKADVLAKLGAEVDLWVASATAGGDAYLIPLSFYWDGAVLVLATPAASRTARNLRRAGRARVALGPTRDVVTVEGPVEFIPADEVGALGDAHAEATGFDARREPEPYVYIRLTPARIQVWREANELAGREIMRDGHWLV